MFYKIWLILDKWKPPGCVIEEQVNYAVHNLGGDNAVSTVQENPQACAEKCVATEGGLFWTYNLLEKECWIKTSDSERRYHQDVVSGSRACGLSKPKISAKLTSVAVIASRPNEQHPPKQCSDADPDTFCFVDPSPAPWLALYLGTRANVDRVEIEDMFPMTSNKNSNKDNLNSWNITVWVTDSLPSSGD